jgi:hypothetical protein
MSIEYRVSVELDAPSGQDAELLVDALVREQPGANPVASSWLDRPGCETAIYATAPDAPAAVYAATLILDRALAGLGVARVVRIAAEPAT